MSALGNVVQRIQKLQDALRGKPDFRWGVVQSVDPITVRLDADEYDLPGRVPSLVNNLTAGDRVRVEMQGSRAVVHGVGGGVGTGWFEIATPAGYTTTRPIWVRNVGGIVYWVGRVKPTSAKSGTVTFLPAGTVPEWGRPSYSGYDAMRIIPSEHSTGDASGAFKAAMVEVNGSVTIYFAASNTNPVNLAGLSGYLAGIYY